MKQIIAYGLLVCCGGVFYTDSKTMAAPVAQSSTGHPTTYYLANNGSDANSGTTPHHAWQSIANLNLKRVFGPGDQILFKCGDSFAGGLAVTLKGTSSSPCRLGSYGSGVATLTNVTPYANICTILNSEYFTVEHLRFITAPGINYPGTNFVPKDTSYALYVTSTTHSGEKYRSIHVNGCSFKYSRMGFAMVVDKDATTDGFDDVKVTHCIFDSTYCVGCFIVGYNILKSGPVDQLSHVYVGYNQFYRVYGDPHEPNEAEPLYVGSASGVVIERNLFGDNCGYGGALNMSAAVGSTAFSVSNCRDFRMQYNEVYGTRCSSKYDGSAIDLDQDSQNGEVCYNLTYGNAGPSIQLGSFGGTTTKNIAIHHNISYDDARGCQTNSVQGAIRLWGNLDRIQIFNNSICVDKSGSVGTPSCLSFEGGHNDNVRVLNNLFKTTGGVPMIRPNGSAGGDCKFIGNCYDSGGGPLTISTDDTHGHYTNITSLAAWQAVGQESLGGILHGVVEDAGLTALGSFQPPKGGFLPKTEVSKVHNFDLMASSICRGKAIDPSSFITLRFPIVPQRTDYHGNLSLGADIGAAQATGRN